MTYDRRWRRIGSTPRYDVWEDETGAVAILDRRTGKLIEISLPARPLSAGEARVMYG